MSTQTNQTRDHTFSRSATPPPAPTAPSAPRAAWAIVAKREILAKLFDKSFLIGTVLTVVIIAGFMVVQAFMQDRTQTYNLVASGSDVSYAKTLGELVTKVDDKVVVDVRSAATADAARAEVLDGSADAWLHKDGDDWTLTAATEVPDGLNAAASTVVRQSMITSNAEKAGTTVAAIEQGATLKSGILKGDADKQGFAKVMGFVLAFLFYMASIAFGMQLAGSVVEEKASRIVEIIATKIPVRQLLIGKILGNLLMAVAQMVLYTGIGLIGLSFTQYKSYLPSVGAGVGWFLAFFLVGFLLLACLWAVAGSLASRSEDLQQTAMPLSMMLMLVWFSLFLAKGTVATVLSFVPLFSAVLMPMRILQGGVPVWQPLVALALSILAAGAVVLVAERLYRRALLQTQGRLSIRQAWAAAE